MDRAELKDKAKSLIKGKCWNIFLFIFLFFFVEAVIVGILNAIPVFKIDLPTHTETTVNINGNVFVNSSSTGPVSVGILGSVASFLLSGAISFAISRGLLKFVDKKKVPSVKEEAKDALSSEYYARALWATIRVEVFTFLWSLLFVIPGIIKAISYSQTMFILAENDKITAAEAQKKSMEIMDGHKWEYFVLQLSFIGWDILTGLTFGILGIYTLPYQLTANTLFYKKVSK